MTPSDMKYIPLFGAAVALKEPKRIVSFFLSLSLPPFETKIQSQEWNLPHLYNIHSIPSSSSTHMCSTIFSIYVKVAVSSMLRKFHEAFWGFLFSFFFNFTDWKQIHEFEWRMDMRDIQNNVKDYTKINF